MKGRKPFATRMKIAFAAAATVFGVGLGTGGLESLPKDADTDTQKVTTFQKADGASYGYNISPFDQAWKAGLLLREPHMLGDDAVAAADKGDSWRTQAVLDRGFSVYSPGAHDAFALAALRGHSDVFNTYLKAGIDPSANDGKALTEALRGGHVSLAYTLLERGVSGSSQMSEGLSIAATRGDAQMVDALLKAGANAKANDSAALKYAAMTGHTDVMSSLLQAGAEVTNDAVRLAAESGKLDALKALVAAGGDVSADNGAALVMAATYGHADVVSFILEQKKTYFGGGYEIGAPGDLLSSFTGAAVSPNAQGGAALIAAVEAGNMEIVRLLLDAGATPDASSGSALASAVFNNNYGMAEYLLMRGADANAGDGKALFMAVTMDNASMTQLLMGNKANPDLRNGEIKAMAEKSKNNELKEVVKGKTFPHLSPYFGY